MYRSICMLSIVLLFISCTYPPHPSELKQMEHYQDMKKEVLFNKTLSFIARFYVSGKDVIQLQSRELSQIICKCYGTEYDCLYYRGFKYTMIIDFKDENIRVIFENIRSDDDPGIKGLDIDRNWNNVSKHLEDVANQLFISINSSKSGNW